MTIRSHVSQADVEDDDVVVVAVVVVVVVGAVDINPVVVVVIIRALSKSKQNRVNTPEFACTPFPHLLQKEKRVLG